MTFLDYIPTILVFIPPLLGNPFSNLFQKLDAVVRSCFGDTLALNYADVIDDFFDEVEKMKIPFTNKMHALKFHVKEFIVITNSSLGPYSEQAMEAVHYDYEKQRKRFADHSKKENVDGMLLRSVCAYNSAHL